jgi:hypothetical protein
MKKSAMMAASQDAKVVLDNISKAALIDLYCCALARLLGSVGTPVTPGEVASDANPVLAARGDRLIKA